MPTADELKQRIETAIPGAQASVSSPDDVHFAAHVQAPAFAGLNLVQQHRMVYEIFGGELGATIHALSLKTEVTT
jgi:stress-induced morphogen